MIYYFSICHNFVNTVDSDDSIAPTHALSTYIVSTCDTSPVLLFTLLQTRRPSLRVYIHVHSLHSVFHSCIGHIYLLNILNVIIHQLPVFFVCGHYFPYVIWADRVYLYLYSRKFRGIEYSISAAYNGMKYHTQKSNAILLS